jgi:hypothetical protein
MSGLDAWAALCRSNGSDKCAIRYHAGVASNRVTGMDESRRNFIRVAAGLTAVASSGTVLVAAAEQGSLKIGGVLTARELPQALRIAS